MQEGEGLAQYNEQTAEIMKVTKGKAVQRVEAASAITLLEDAISEKDTFFAFFREFEAVCRTEGIGLLLVLPKKGDATKCKDLLRVIEKCCLRPGTDEGDARCVTDVLRAMLVANSMTEIAKVQRVLLRFVTEGKIVIDRTKDRFVQSPSAGGCTVLASFWLVAWKPKPRICGSALEDSPDPTLRAERFWCEAKVGCAVCCTINGMPRHHCVETIACLSRWHVPSSNSYSLPPPHTHTIHYAIIIPI
jgi:hypothetical protein